MEVLTPQLDTDANKKIFASFYKEVWRKLIPQGLTEAEVNFIEDVAQLTPHAKILDLMCGYGRHAIALARRGYEVTAVDSLQEYIDEIKTIAANEALAINAVLQDVSEGNFSGVFDAVVFMGNCFSGLNAANVTRVLAGLNKSLIDGGVFIIDSWMIGEIAIKHFEAKTWLYVDEYKYLLDNKYLLNPSRVETDHILIRDDGQIQNLKGVDFIFSFAELEILLNNSGFKIKDLYSTPKKKKYQFGDNRVYIVAQKIAGK